MGTKSPDRNSNVDRLPAMFILSHPRTFAGKAAVSWSSRASWGRRPAFGVTILPRALPGLPGRSLKRTTSAMPSTARENLAKQAASPMEDVSTQPDSLPSTVRDKPFAWLLLITGVVGWLASGALVLEKLEVLKDPNHVTVCDVNPFISCGEVMQTPQSSVFGFPNMFIGIVAFAVIITTAMGILAGAKYSRGYWLGLQTGVTLGFAFVVWLWSQALYVIHVLCPFCMVVWAAMIPLFVWVTIRNITSGVIKSPPALVKLLSGSGWIIVALLYVAVITTIFFSFMHLFVPSTA
ncbi:putative integral membrane protein [Arthrobacter sp. Rue61a]|nr:putative integral membrane protein [Arthrobacter sp. Rue61a]